MRSTTADPDKPLRSTVKTFWVSTICSVLLAPLLFLLCLRQWGSDHPWSRLDLYAAVFLVVGILVALEEAVSFACVGYRSKEVAQEAFGYGYDAYLYRAGTLLNLALIFVVIDYAHWHLVPALERPFLQDIGVALGLLGLIWQAWADFWLGRHFAGDLATRKLMTTGPFRFIRHPRYAGFLLRKLAWPLLLASVIGWALFALWLALVIRRIRLEEDHMIRIFGNDYQAYTRRSARLFLALY